MGNTNCNNAVPCMGEGQQDSPSGRRIQRKQGVTTNSRVSHKGGKRRNIEGFLDEQQSQGHLNQSTRNTERLLNYGAYQMADETGIPHHYLLDTVTSSGSSEYGQDGIARKDSRSNMLYSSQNASLFEEFVDQTLTNFSQSEFDKSISLLEFVVQSQVFTRKHLPEKKKSKFSMSSKSKQQDEKSPDPKMQYCISIGDVVMCKWSGDEENWESKSNNPSEYPYTETSATINSSLIDSQRSRKSIKKDASPAFPDVVTKRLCIPFEFRFTNQEVQLEIRDISDNCLLYEAQIPFEQLLSEPQLLQEPSIILASSDSRHLVRLSVRELQESQKMLCRFTLAEQARERQQSNNDSILVEGDDKVDLWSTKTEVFEIIQPLAGKDSYKMRCLHINQGMSDIMKDPEIPMTLLVPHYEVGFFKDRLFQIEFDKTKFIQLTGFDLSSLARQGEISKHVAVLPRQKKILDQQPQRMILSEQNSRDQISQEEVKGVTRLSIPRTETSTNNATNQLLMGAGSPEFLMTPNTDTFSGNTPSQGTPLPRPSQSFNIVSNQTFKITAPVVIERPLSTIGLIQSGDLRVVPLIGIDFSLGNLTFEDNTVMHSTNPSKPNDYRSLLRMLSHAYRNVLNLPIFGYGSKTSTFSSKTCNLFPMSRSIRNPFTPNDENSIDQAYSDCLSTLELSVPVNLTPLVNFMKKLGQHQEKRLKRKSVQQESIKGTFDTFYVLYVLSTGIIDDVQELIGELRSKEWKRMPLQVHLISFAPNHLQEKDQDTQALCDEVNKLNVEAGWPQFQIHFFDRIKKKVKSKGQRALLRLKQDCVLRVPRDIESCCFANKYNLGNYKHNQNLTNATQSQQYIMDIIDQKFEKLKDSVYKLGISPMQFRNMVEGQALYEWSPEVALSLSTRFCSWVVAETDAEHNAEETEESRSLLLGGRMNRFDSMLQPRSNSQLSNNALRASSSSIGRQQKVCDDQKNKTNPSNEQDNEVGEPSTVPDDKAGIWQNSPMKKATEDISLTANFSQSAAAAIEESSEAKGNTDAFPEQVTSQSQSDQLVKNAVDRHDEGDNPEVIVPNQAQQEKSQEL